MKQKIKVQLDFNITRKIHSLYHSFFNNPPEGVEYLKSEFKGINDKTYSKLGKLRKKLIKIFPPLAKLQTFILSILRKESNSDLIHFTFHLGKTKKPCVIDYESAYTFIDINNPENIKNKKKAIKMLNKKNVKYLMPINEEALKSFKLFFGNSVKKPQEIVYPTIVVPEEFRKKTEKKKQVIFVSTANNLEEKAFLIKGGLETLTAFISLAKKYKSYKFIIIGKIPKSFERKIPKNLVLIEGVSREKMWKILNESEIFVQPSYQFSSMASLEAMWFKLPIVTTSFWVIPEYVDSKNGVIVDTIFPNHLDKNGIPNYPKKVLKKIKDNAQENAKNIERAVEKLIKDPSLRKKLGENGFKRVTEGKFSIQEKNKKLIKIYEYALKN
jgi:glycosyltransferase involved in cell wall biosynthesis